VPRLVLHPEENRGSNLALRSIPSSPPLHTSLP
jgi:hypothetical protein